MTKQIVNLGVANKGNGDPIRTAFDKVNQNFTELYNAIGLGDGNLNIGAFEFSGSTMTTTDSSDIVIAQRTQITSNLTVQGDILPSVANGGDLGSLTRPWRSLYVSNSTIYLGSTPLSVDADGNILIDGNVYGGGTADLGNLKIESSTLGTQGADSNSWGNHNLYLDPGGESNAYISIPSVPNQEEGNALQIYNKGDATSIVQVFGRGGVQVVTNTGEDEHVFEFRDDGKLQLPPSGDILDSTGTSVIGGVSPTQPYLELTDTPFITQPVTLGTPVTAIADLRGQDALVEVVIGEGPVIESITVTTPGVLYVVGQRYRINYYQVGGNSDNGNIDFEVATVGAGGALLTIANAAFEGPAQVNTGTYSNTSIEYRPTEFDIVGTGLTLTRGLYGGLFNSEEEFSYNSSVSPIGTLWNADGWGTLVGFNTRTYDTFDSILTGPDNTPPGELIMWDTINDKYYKFAINIWGVDNNEFSYIRTLITDPNYFKKDDYATANDVDVIEDDSTLQIGITRGLNGGIYNPFTEEDWNSNVSPDGTLWNVDGWNDLTDVETRTYTNFYAAYDQQLGNLVPGSQAVMYVPSIDKYYAIEWISWTQGIGGNTQGGGFSYTRREIDLTKLDQGVRFADGTVQTTAYAATNVVSTAPRDRRIETASGYKEVSFTAVTTSNTYNPVSIARPDGAYNWDLYIDKTTNPVLEAAINLYGQYGGQDHSWRVTINGQVYTNDQLQVYIYNDYIIIYSGDQNVTLPGDAGISVTIERITGNIPVVWWDKTDLPGGAGDFRGAVIDYHAYTGSGTIIGTIHIVDDDSENYITHTEVSSGSNSSMNDNLWIVTNEGQIKYARFDLEARTLKIHWTAKVFYGSELYD